MHLRSRACLVCPVTSPVLLPVSQIIATARTSFPSPQATNPGMPVYAVHATVPRNICARLTAASHSGFHCRETTGVITPANIPHCTILGSTFKQGRFPTKFLSQSSKSMASYRMHPIEEWCCRSLSAHVRNQKKRLIFMNESIRVSHSLYSFFCACSPLAPHSLTAPVTSPASASHNSDDNPRLHTLA